MRTPKPRRVTVTRYVDPRTGQRVPKGTKGARRERVKTDTYYAKIGGKRTSLETTSEAQAWVNLRLLLKRHAEGLQGLRDEYTEAAQLAIARHVEEWLQTVSDRGSSLERVALMRARVLRLAEAAKWRRLSDISSPSCLSALARLQSEEDLAPQTRNHYLSHAKQFCKWLSSGSVKRLRYHPLDGLKPVSVEEDKRRERRCPTDEEVARLFAWLATGEADDTSASKRSRKWSMADRSSPIRLHMSGSQRAVGYKICMAAGLRAGELRTLRRDSFNLKEGILNVRASYSKHRRHDAIHLPAWLVAEVKDWFASGGGCWERFPAQYPGRLLRFDLDGAGVACVTEGPNGPLYFDFQALRHYYCTQVANQPGISPKTLQVLCRHSTPELTLRIYAKAKLHDVRAAAEQLPNPAKPSRPRAREQ